MKRLRLRRALALAFVFPAAVWAADPSPPPVIPAIAKWSSAEKWAEFKDDDYTVRNNIWGEKPGVETVWAASAAHFGVWADHPNTGGIKSYPHAEKAVHRRLSEIKDCTSHFACTVPATGAYNTAYDIWCNQHAYEIMVWFNWAGPVAPISQEWGQDGKPVPVLKNLTIGGHTWNVFRGTNGHNEVFSFLRTTPADEGTLEIKELLGWIRGAGWFGDVTLDEVQLGWEITSSAGGLPFEIRDYAVTVR